MCFQFFLTFYMRLVPLALAIGYIADLIFGDPQYAWHPIRLIGRLTAAFERALRVIFKKSPKGERAAGTLLVILVLFCCGAAAFVLLFFCFRIHWILGFFVQSWMSYTIPATRSLGAESRNVRTALGGAGLPAGRRALSRIVGRDVDSLDEAGVIRAAVETVAENTTDGVVAPLFFLAVGGPILGYIYKAANTMDSMVGYKNKKYRYFGTAAAKLDDALNFFPARVSAVFMVIAVFFCEKVFPAASRASHSVSAKRACEIRRRDKRKHESPNAAQTEAVMAGALGIQLAGDASYFGVRKKKPVIGDALRPAEPEDILRAQCLMYATSAITAAIFFLIRFLIAGQGL